ncbi:class I adenylate-forming enzyme family protein [Haliea sp.]|jgi:acyl-CoA synthetase|uniref:class I adenylate-forming enzyme family protein n=1 Tax=Haliea sp. TaxID=1932666 RepID=UPI000C6884AB|nr:class I adenylate-forming enzyme family protein [Haliea sp.]MAD63078.1 hypothetical protein [Haliea sp.]MAY91529.1 hypothetical protein [Haliea sp.]MBK40512.1 hypothetical protein [Haliea sp.]MBP68611.1 hypothetical protein [Haliea sp.]|tara:strand:+ start:10262 stop:11887 length:1626 start_codon:yes stop_codon:yes gene_type:complete
MISKANPTGKETLADVIAVHAKKKPQAIAFIAGERTMNWQQYADWSDQLAGVFIRSGLKPGERVALLLPDSLEIHAAFVACEKAGVVGMAISSRAGEKEIRHLVKVSGSVMLLSQDASGGHRYRALFEDLEKNCPSLERHIELLASLDQPEAVLIDGMPIDHAITGALLTEIGARQAGPEDLFLLNTTSGTTGMPKCVTQHQRRWFEYAELAQDSADLAGQDVFLRAVPASVGFGLWSGHFIPTLLGSTTVILPKFSVEALLEAIEVHEVSILIAVSTQFIMMLNHLDLERYDFKSLRTLYTGGEAVPYERAARFEEVTGAIVLQFYGSNETGALSYTSIRDTQEQRLTTAGRTIPSMNVRLIDKDEKDCTDTGRGQPICKGLLTCKGYFNNEEANQKLFTSDSAMKMEDIVTIDSKGYLRVVGRVGDFIIRGGKNISAVAVEEVVLAHPQVEMAAAVAMPDPVFGERVCIYVVEKSLANLSLPMLVEFLDAQGVSKEYFPEKMILLDELPVVSGGKVAKHVLREDIRVKTEAGFETSNPD